MRDTFERSEETLDLVAIATLSVVTAFVLIGFDTGRSILWLLTVPFLLFFPGYAMVSAMFPEQPASSTGATPGSPLAKSREDTPGWTVRIALSIVLSAVVVAVAGVALDWTTGIRLVPAVVVIAGVTLSGVSVALVRRLRRPRERQANPFAGRSLDTLSVGSRAQNIALVVAVVALVGAVAFVGATPTQGEPFTESYLLTEDDDGDLVADEYPTTFVAGEETPLHLGLENSEHRQVTYEVAVVLQDVDSTGDVVTEERIDRFSVSLEHDESAVTERALTPTMTGDGLRLQFQIYTDGDPDDGTDPDHTHRLWINVPGAEE